MLNKIRENKFLKITGSILYYILVVFVLLILTVAIIQRFSNNAFGLGGYRIFNIATGSMVPKYEIGAILVSKEIEPSKIKIGDDIVYKGEKGSFQDKVITHQVVQIEKENKNYKFHTKGIANEEEDPVISENQVYGKVIYEIKSLTFISKIINNIYAFYFLIFIPIAIIIIRQIKIIIDNHRENNEEREATEQEKQEDKPKEKLKDKQEDKQEKAKTEEKQQKAKTEEKQQKDKKKT